MNMGVTLFNASLLFGGGLLKIVVLDGYAENPGDLSWDGLKALGTLKVYDRTNAADEKEIINRIGDAEIALTNKTPISRRVIDACPGLRFISVLATGYNVVDVAYCKEKRIPVSNVPAYGTAAVSQYSIAMLLEICHHIGHHNDAVHKGRWEHSPDWCFWDYPLIELEGKTIGIIGFGRIGRAEGKIARALGMKVLAYDIFQDDEGKETAEYVDLDTLYKNADVISLHCFLTPENTGMINRESIRKMKKGVILINNARGQLLIEKDVAAALNNGHIAAAALDVVSSEPIQPTNPLLNAKNCIITPHISWATQGCRQRIMNCSIENVTAYMSGHPINLVNS